MAQYDVYVTCNECGGVHPMGMGIYLENGPIDKQNITDTYQGRSLPPQVQAIKGQNSMSKDRKAIYTRRQQTSIFGAS
jgi:hypothetical protein